MFALPHLNHLSVYYGILSFSANERFHECAERARDKISAAMNTGEFVNIREIKT